MYRNWDHETIQTVRDRFYAFTESLSFYDQLQDPLINQLEIALSHTNNTSFKILHPLLIAGYRMPNVRYATEPLKVIGLDIETDHKTGHPKLLGLYYESDIYHHIQNPSVFDLYTLIKNLTNNTYGINFAVWGNLDIQCIIRLFIPTEDERKRISRGISANIKQGKIIGDPPLKRQIGKDIFYISHYIPGRSLKLGILSGKYDSVCWFFNISQFYPGTIAQTAKGLNLHWKDFSRSTHLIDWTLFQTSTGYHKLVIESNKQDARIVRELVDILQKRFFDVFGCYPKLLVSSGSLSDTAVSKMLNTGTDYESNNWQWLARHVWKNPEIVKLTECLLAETYSAGYVDQYAVGFFPKICSADISAAYPHKIRALPDLRLSVLASGKDNLENDIKLLEEKYIVETAIIRGKVTIPNSLRFHPITIKTYNRENFRPTGTFFAGYTLDERNWCLQHGATFDHEEYVIICLTQRKQAPIALVSEKLGEMRDSLLAEYKTSKNGNEKLLLNGQQFMVKVVDNSAYGKTVMTTEVVENINGMPEITGYIAGDRFNMLYGTLITARTRIQIAQACLDIVANGGKPVMVMTDSVYWEGNKSQLPLSLLAEIKTPGFFEPPTEYTNFYLIKTGQYEYFSLRTILPK